MEWNEIKERLQEPFTPEEVSWKPQKVTKDGTRALAVAYIDARSVMDRLDDVVGAGEWADSYDIAYVDEDCTAVECTLTVHAVSKTDVGTAERTEREKDQKSGAYKSPAYMVKAAYSDALKRAGVKWGIGRYLYSLPKTWANYDPKRKQLIGAPKLPDWALPGAAAKPPKVVTEEPPEPEGADEPPAKPAGKKAKDAKRPLAPGDLHGMLLTLASKDRSPLKESPLLDAVNAALGDLFGEEVVADALDAIFGGGDATEGEAAALARWLFTDGDPKKGIHPAVRKESSDLLERLMRGDE